MEKNKELIDSLIKFQILLNTHPDTVDSIPVFTNYIRSFLRIKPMGRTLPTIEIMTLLKNEKPRMFYLLKRHSSDDIMMMLTNLSMDYNQAQNKIKRILQGEVIA
ncbi:hypothetical protein [Fictibacillus phosphorivorans]|uniref:hypothetical protein n=1 Tax=Fictibacillus phosphorivorans TaxID=1221500 RepID=UPI002041B404|nr:hypothetical protein [Fictibacillus phosphorivorans]MCM3720104.1 hypothetical protein [Fictibacillus phosphorivorans]MCM3777794.1 hypothetical protein [Fictibacillus phosphorivorans]